MSYNYDPVTLPANGTTATASPVQTPTASAEGGVFSQTAAATEVDSMLSTNSASIADIEAKLANATDEEAKQILLAEKQRLVEERAKLQAKQVKLQGEIKVIKTEFEESKARLDQLKSDLTQLQDKKAKYESTLKEDNKLLQAKQEAVSDTECDISSTSSDLASEIEKMESSAKSIESESNNELQSQRQAVSQASLIAQEKVKAGQMQPEDVPGFIASQVSSFTSIGSTGRMDELSSQNSKIKTYCKRLGSLITKKINLENYTTALSAKVSSSGELVDSMKNEISSKQTSFNAEKVVYTGKLNSINAKKSEYQANDAQINIIDARMQAVDTRYAQYGSTPAAQGAQASSAATQGAATQAQAQASQNTSNTESNTEESDYSSYDNIFEKINSDFETAVSKAVSNGEVASYQGNVEEAESLIVTLRHKLSDDAQKIIEERLAATKRQ